MCGSKNEIGFRALDYLAKSERKAIRRVFFEQIVLDKKHLVELEAGKLVGKSGDAFADDDARERALGLLGDLLRGGERLEAALAQLAIALFGDQEDLHNFVRRRESFGRPPRRISSG